MRARLQFSLYLQAAVSLGAAATQASSDFLPVSIHVGQQPSLDTSSPKTFTLDAANGPFATIDYGYEVAGFPFFEVASLPEGQSAQIEVRYAEQYDVLTRPFADGPYNFAVQLSNSFRVETYEITKAGRYRARLLQGGQRWQTIRLISGDTITFSGVGLEATIETTPIAELPGKFNSSDDRLNRIWDLGAVAVAAACLEKGSQPAIWEVDPVKGVYLRSTRPAQTLEGAFFANYTLEFDALIERGGIWWASPWAFGRFGGLQLLLVGDLPVSTSFANTNRTMFPPNSILMSWGYDFVNQTTLTSYYLDTFELPFAVPENTWHRLSTVLQPDGVVSVSVDGTQIFKANIGSFYTGPPGPFGGAFSALTGSFGFGAYQDHAAYVRNVEVTAANGTRIYSNSMTDSSVLEEYGTGANLYSVCLDGPKRDRLVWLGDYYHTARIVGVSTGRHDLLKGTFELLLATQVADGEFNPNAAMGYDPSVTAPFVDGTGAYGLQDYQLLGLGAFYHYVSFTNDLDFVKSTWIGWQKQMEFVVNGVNTTGTGLWYGTSAFLGPSTGGSAVSCLALQVLHQMAQVASAIGDAESAEKWTLVAQGLDKAINSLLWDDARGFYALAPGDAGNFSTAATGFCITSGAASAEQTRKLLAAIPALAQSPGYLDNSATDASDPATNISPNTNGFLLDALFEAGASEAGLALIDSLWGAMIDDPSTSSGASWEYVNTAGGPGLGAFTSLAHPWGGAATYILTHYVAGIRAADGVAGFGYKNWIMDPEAGVKKELRYASAEVPTAYGSISVHWEVVAGGQLSVFVQAPAGTSGVFVYKGLKKKLCGKPSYHITVPV